MNATTAIARMMTRNEYAAIMGVTTTTLKNWEVQGKGPMPIRIGRAVRYNSEEVAEFVRCLRQAGRAAKAKPAAAEDAISAEAIA